MKKKIVKPHFASRIIYVFNGNKVEISMPNL